VSFSNILVTGCGGDIGLSIGRILKMANIANQVIGCDIQDQHPGAFIFDHCETIVRVDQDNYLESLIQTARKNCIDLIIPASEPELRFFLQKDLFTDINGIPILTANKKALTVGFDKLETVNFLRVHGLLYPWTQIVKNGPPSRIPCIIKSRCGSGSRDIRIVESELVDYYIRHRSDDIWQEYLFPDDQEYTCGVYRDKQGETRSIIIKRRLQGGHTVYGEVVSNDEIEKMLCKLAKGLELYGSINVQLRLTDRGPVVFEINPRFSSTVVFRHLLGYQDLIWSIIELSNQPLNAYQASIPGTKFYRGDYEYIKKVEN
jgi:carbamoyl-phosphate synthase large subunit